jgi:endogenous inhibitor of DNA gyrase (YacG/DUF329 family)
MKPTQAPVVTCPQCKKSSLWDSANPFRPFCCERCKMIDLGKWASEEYRVEQPPEFADFMESDPRLTQ